MDLTRILRKGDTIYSPALGYVVVESIRPNGMTVSSDEGKFTFYPDGKYVKNGEVMLKANKRDNFTDYPFKRGDYLVTKTGDTFIASGKNRIFVGAAVAIQDGKLYKDQEDWAAVDHFATDYEQSMFDQELAELGYKWDGDKLVSVERWVNIYRDYDGTYSSSKLSYSSKDEAYSAKENLNYYTTVRIK